MKKHAVRIAVYGTLVAAASVLALLPSSLAQQHGLDVWNVPQLEAEIEVAEAEYVEMDKETQVVLEHIGQKEALILELLDGQIELLEAARHFREMSVDNPCYLSTLRDNYPGRSLDECFCLNVLDYASRWLAERPELAANVAELKRQFESSLHRGNGVSLDH